MYSLWVRYEDGIDKLVGTWTDEWMARSYGEKYYSERGRTIVKWQMLNMVVIERIEATEREG